MSKAAEVLGKLSGVLPGFDRRVWFLLFAMLVFRLGQGLFYPFSTIYLANFVGIPLSLIGVGLASLAVASIVSGLIAGPMTDRFGRKPMMLLALSGSAATFFLFSQVGSFAGYVAVCAAAGLVGSSMFDAARNAMVAGIVEPGKRARAYGLVRVGGNVGWAAGPTFAGFTAAFAGSSAATYSYWQRSRTCAASIMARIGTESGEVENPAVLGISNLGNANVNWKG